MMSRGMGCAVRGGVWSRGLRPRWFGGVLCVLAAGLWVGCGGDGGGDVAASSDSPVPSSSSDVGSTPSTADVPEGPSSTGPGSSESGSRSEEERPDAGPALPDRLLTAEEMRGLVDPWIGSGGQGFGYASLTPAAQWPNGLVKVGPDTTNNGNHLPQQHFSGYLFDDPDVRGFSHLRLVGTGAADLGILRLLPLAEEPFRDGEVWTAMDKESEWATPGRFGVRLPEAGVDVTLVAGSDHAWHRYDRFGTGPLFLLVDPLSSVTDRESESARIAVDEEGLLDGHLFFRGPFTGRRGGFDVWYRARITPAPDGMLVHDGEGWVAEPARAATDRRVVLTWSSPPSTVTVHLALSLLDAETAERRLAEVEVLDEDTLGAAAEAEWDAIFERYRFHGRHGEDAVKLATAIYNLYRMPTRHAAAGERYRGFDGEAHLADGHDFLSDLSLWDSFRTLHPVLELAHPDLARDATLSLLRMAEQTGGAVPRWPSFLGDTGSMLGSPAANVFAGALLKGIVDDETGRVLLATMYASDYGVLDGGDHGRTAVEALVELGYIPEDINESVSLHLEYSWADDAVARMAEHLGLEDTVPEAMAGRSRWGNLFDDQTRFFQPRDREGAFQRVRNPMTIFMRSGPFTEGNAWHWRFYPLWDLDAFAERFGPEELGEQLERFFAGSDIARDRPVNTLLPDTMYWHGNEPPLSAVWMFRASDRPERGPHWVARILDRAYGTGADGVPGNDDGGTLSAWLVAAMWGLYPVAGTDAYLIGALHVEEVVLPDTTHGVVRLVRHPDLRRTDEACIRDESGATHVDRIRHADVRGTLTFVPLADCADD